MDPFVELKFAQREFLKKRVTLGIADTAADFDRYSDDNDGVVAMTNRLRTAASSAQSTGSRRRRRKRGN